MPAFGNKVFFLPFMINIWVYYTAVCFSLSRHRIIDLSSHTPKNQRRDSLPLRLLQSVQQFIGSPSKGLISFSSFHLYIATFIYHAFYCIAIALVRIIQEVERDGMESGVLGRRVKVKGSNDGGGGGGGGAIYPGPKEDEDEVGVIKGGNNIISMFPLLCFFICILPILLFALFPSSSSSSSAPLHYCLWMSSLRMIL